MSIVDPKAVWVTPLVGTGLAILITAATCGAISFLVVSLRTMIRLREQVFGLDDGLMLGGMVTAIPSDYTSQSHAHSPISFCSWLKLSWLVSVQNLGSGLLM
jgi:hypothetical protein